MSISRAQPEHAIDRGDFLLHVLRLLEQSPEHFAVDRHRAPLNQAVIAQALYDLRNGQLHRTD